MAKLKKSDLQQLWIGVHRAVQATRRIPRGALCPSDVEAPQADRRLWPALSGRHQRESIASILSDRHEHKKRRGPRASPLRRHRIRTLQPSRVNQLNEATRANPL